MDVFTVLSCETARNTGPYFGPDSTVFVGAEREKGGGSRVCKTSMIE